MIYTLFIQFLTLSAFAFFAGFCFCDGFNLPIYRKVIWFLVFLAISAYILKTEGEFNLALILPVPILFAILLCNYEKRKRSRK